MQPLHNLIQVINALNPGIITLAISFSMVCSIWFYMIPLLKGLDAKPTSPCMSLYDPTPNRDNLKQCCVIYLPRLSLFQLPLGIKRWIVWFGVRVQGLRRSVECRPTLTGAVNGVLYTDLKGAILPATRPKYQ